MDLFSLGLDGDTGQKGRTGRVAHVFSSNYKVCSLLYLFTFLLIRAIIELHLKRSFNGRSRGFRRYFFNNRFREYTIGSIKVSCIMQTTGADKDNYLRGNT
jgi:hypothetical protein